MYRMFLRGQSRTLELPVLPEKINVQSDGNNKTDNVLQLGEINQLQNIKLLKTGWESLFPTRYAPYAAVATPLAPIEYIRAIQAWRAALVPVRLLITGTELDINQQMAVESLEYEERGGEPGDLYYTIELKQYVDYTPRRISMQDNGKAVVLLPEREGAIVKPSTYTVQAGDTLWMIAQKYYGDGSRYAEIYAANKSVMDTRNQTSGNPRYTLYTGQVLTLP